MRGGAEIQQALRRFVTRWADYTGSERSEAQTYLNELFACYGTDRKEAGAEFEESHSSAGIMDLYWRDIAIVEMKAPAEAPRLANHRPQALRYWQESSDVTTGRPAPRYVVLCAFHLFEVWEPGRFPNEPRAGFALADLPDRYDALLFLTAADDEPLFAGADRALTHKAASAVADLYHALLERNAGPRERIQSFVLKLVWLFFAEDYGLIADHPLERILRLLKKDAGWSSTMFGGLFAALNDPQDAGRQGALRGTPYVNGEMFAESAAVHLTAVEARAALEAARYDWRGVDPTIFGC